MNDTQNLPTNTKLIPLVAGGQVKGIIPQNVEEAFRMAQLICKSGLCPQHLKTPEAVLTTILHGAEIGLPPMFALSKIAVINGRPTIWGDAITGLVRASGLAEYIKETIEGEADEMTAVCETLRKGETEPVIERFSVADAKTAGLWDERKMVTRKSKSGGTYEAKNDSPWFRFPKRMLKMRARVALRDTYADVLGGLYLKEEFEGVTVDHIEVPEPPALPDAAQEAAAKQKLTVVAEVDLDAKYKDILWEFGQQAEGTDKAGMSELVSEYEPLMEGAPEDMMATFNAIAGGN